MEKTMNLPRLPPVPIASSVAAAPSDQEDEMLKKLWAMRVERRCLSAALVLRLAGLTVALLLVAAVIPVSGQEGGKQWVGTWSASPQSPGFFRIPFDSGFNNQTIREIVHTSIGGGSVRLRLTNAFGSKPVSFDAVYVGIEQSGATLVPGSNHAVTFGGSTSTTIPVGAERLSDPIPLIVGSDQNLAISLFSAEKTGPSTTHIFAGQTNYVSGAGNFAADDGGGAFTTTTGPWYFLDGVDVLVSPSVKGAVVALGDSITDGVGSTVNENQRWPNDLARRFLANSPGLVMSVLDEGIIGNRVLNDSACFGVSVVARLDRDVLAQTSVLDVILLEGLNDIGFSQFHNGGCIKPNTNVSADQIIAGYEQIIAQIHAKGLRIFGGTLTPFKGSGYWSPTGEAKRVAVNIWIKTSGKFDGFIDFAAAVADPNDPRMIAPQYDSGDHLHPNDAGYQAMADAVDLALFLP
jgi:lysophospholipase L1-like esterase